MRERQYFAKQTPNGVDINYTRWCNAPHTEAQQQRTASNTAKPAPPIEKWAGNRQGGDHEVNQDQALQSQ